MMLPPVRFFTTKRIGNKKTGLKKAGLPKNVSPSLAIRLSYVVDKTRDFPPHSHEWFGFV
jgi:hypothetical protein